MSVTTETFGIVHNTVIEKFTIVNKNGVFVKIITLGATLVDFSVPDETNHFSNICLSFDSVDEYLKSGYFGTTVGRFANRIAKGQFTLNGVSYQLPINNGINSLHGGSKGFDKQIWKATPGKDCVTLFYQSMDGEQGYPGTLDVSVNYRLTDENQLIIKYHATCDQDTIINMTNHTFFNLHGEGSGKDILDHVLTLNCDKCIPVDETLIPLGPLKDVDETPFDFLTPKSIGKDIDKVPGGYDHTFCKIDQSDSLTKVARLHDPSSGRTITCSTTEPGIQIYTGNFLDGSRIGKSGIKYKKHFGVCLETQHYPDSPNQKGYPNVILRKGQEYHQTTVYEFRLE
jgi:aldose 1-epimerase